MNRYYLEERRRREEALEEAERNLRNAKRRANYAGKRWSEAEEKAHELRDRFYAASGGHAMSQEDRDESYRDIA